MYKGSACKSNSECVTGYCKNGICDYPPKPDAGIVDLSNVDSDLLIDSVNDSTKTETISMPDGAKEVSVDTFPDVVAASDKIVTDSQSDKSIVDIQFIDSQPMDSQQH